MWRYQNPQWVKSSGQRWETCGITISRLPTLIFNRARGILSILYAMVHSKISFGEKKSSTRVENMPQ